MSQGHYILDAECQQELQKWAKEYGWENISTNISIYESTHHFSGEHREVTYPVPLAWKTGKVISFAPKRKYEKDKHWVLNVNGGYTHRNNYLRSTTYGRKFERLSMTLYLGNTPPLKEVELPKTIILIVGERHIRTGSMDLSKMKMTETKVEEKNENDMEDKPITYPRLVACPHCKGMVEVESLNCGIFRHAIRAKPGEKPVQEPHAKEATLEEWKKKGWLLGCGLPFVIDKKTHQVKAVDTYD